MPTLYLYNIDGVILYTLLLLIIVTLKQNNDMKYVFHLKSIGVYIIVYYYI